MKGKTIQIKTRKEFDRIAKDAGIKSKDDRDWVWRDYQKMYLDRKTSLEEKKLRSFIPGLISLMKSMRETGK